MIVDVTNSITIHRTPRVIQLEGMFDVAPTSCSAQSWRAQLPLEERPWSIGAIVGPSGCGKSTIARAAFGTQLIGELSWPSEHSIADAFPSSLSIKEITLLLSSVGFASPPSWLRPYRALSTGEQFRVTMARILSENPARAVVDEFTSVIDRTVAKIGSCAIAKTVRRRHQQFVAVTCHEDVLDWLDADWIYQPHLNLFQWRGLQRRPLIHLEINRVHHSAWSLFAKHHYLTASLNHSAFCFIAFYDGRPVAFDAWLPFFGRLTPHQPLARRGHRTVCLPDYQGVGIGNALFTHIASMWVGLGYRAFSNTGHPAEIASRLRSPSWRCTRKPDFRQRGKNSYSVDVRRSVDRLVASFEFCGVPLHRPEAERVLTSWAMMN